MSETDTTDTGTDSSTDRPTDLEIIEDAAVLAYAVYRRVDFDKVDAARTFDDEFVGHVESSTHTGSVMDFASQLAGYVGVRAMGTMDGETRSVVRKYDDREGIAAARRFLRIVRRNSQHVGLEMKHSHGNTDAGETPPEDATLGGEF